MKKTYWVKNDPNDAENWIEMDGKQFYDFISSPKGKGRYFIDCETYEIEVTPEQYQKWKKEANHSGYLKQYEDEAVIYSLEAIIENIDAYGDYGNEILADRSTNTEDDVIHAIDLELLKKAVHSLPDDERWLITELFLRDKPKTDQVVSDLTGIPRRTITYRKKIILEKLKIFLPKL